MKVDWVLPAPSGVPIGGYSIVYGHANGLVERGHDVTVHHLPGRPATTPLRAAARHVGPSVRASGHDLVDWYPLDPRVDVRNVRRIERKVGRSADALIATSVATADPVARLQLRRGSAYYFIQHVETFSADLGYVHATWKLPMHKLAISRWLQHTVQDVCGEPVAYVPNGIDPKSFGVDVEPRRRDPHRVVMMGHAYPWKGTSDGLLAFALARKSEPQLVLDVFSAYDPPELPDGVRWHIGLSRQQLRDLYNAAAVFLSPSHTEGWPLPPAEAMACGAAVLTTDIPGVRDYADSETAILVPVGDTRLMAEALVGLARDNDRRVAIATRGRRVVGDHFTLDRSIDALESSIALRAGR